MNLISFFCTATNKPINGILLSVFVFLNLLPSGYSSTVSENRIVELRDTNRFRLDTNGTIRLIGVITPSLNNSNVNKTIAEMTAQSNEEIDKEALFTEKMIAMLLGQLIGVPAMTRILTSYDPLFRDSENLDSQGNLMVYVLLPQFKFQMINYDDYTPTTLSILGRDLEMLAGEKGIMLNASLIRAGLGVVDESADFSEKSKFLDLQKEAREKKRGLWGLSGSSHQAR